MILYHNLFRRFLKKGLITLLLGFWRAMKLLPILLKECIQMMTYMIAVLNYVIIKGVTKFPTNQTFLDMPKK